MSSDHDDGLAYGEYHGHQEEGDQDRGFVGDIFRRVLGQPKDTEQQAPGSSQQASFQFGAYQHHQPGQSQTQAGRMSFVFDKLHKTVHDIGGDLKNKFSSKNEVHAHTHTGGECSDGAHSNTEHRYSSFAPQRIGNRAKWYVDGCGYMWAVSVALEQARESIWILDWWLSPELYLRRPPAQNEQYRLDKMLQAAAQRGVKVNVIVYKEVTQALTLSSAHTKHALEALHPNIAVFRHPDHLPDQAVVASSIWDSLKNLGSGNLTAAAASKMPLNAVKSLYGMHDDTVLYWAHHEKLCLVDGHTAFMGGLDLCYGRWDTNQHSIADVHPGDVSQIVFPGQDYNNARVMDFQDVSHWQNNKLDRTQSSRMGWSDISICLNGPVVEDLRAHFSQRWNFIFAEKYSAKDQSGRYVALPHVTTTTGIVGQGQIPQQSYRGIEGQAAESPANDDAQEHERGLLGNQGRGESFRQRMQDRVEQEYKEHIEGRHSGGHHIGHHGGQGPHAGNEPQGPVECQITRSCAKWSHGVLLEHSIANAYIDIIKNSKHFVYIENQFFITATGDKQKPIRNTIAAAIVERIVRAARNGEKYKMIVVIPSVPAFAGDLRADDSLATRAIMEYQYDSINRGGNSIYESIARAGFDPTQYIRFYNLRNYDRINVSGALKEAEQKSGVSYEDARKQHDEKYGGGFEGRGDENKPSQGYGQRPQYQGDQPYEQYQQGAQKIGSHQGLASGRWDSVAECYMLNGQDIRTVPWTGGKMDEIDAFVSEELYIHSKLIIADDSIVAVGSANLNDRSQLGDHDSEIVCVIQDSSPVQSSMAGRPHQASKFAASLRRQIFRKHLGLLKTQDFTRPDANFVPLGQVENEYDWGSEEDRQVADPLDDRFLEMWNWRAKTNTDAFAKVFHPVPYDGVRTWKQYDDYYERFFKKPKAEDKKRPSTYKWGHVVAENFPGGVEEVKEELAKIRGTLVEMPLLFLKDEDIAKEGLGLNAFTEEVYT